MKRIIIISIVATFILTSCSGLAASRSTEVSDKYGPVTVYSAPT